MEIPRQLEFHHTRRFASATGIFGRMAIAAGRI
jgi:hypothetical protein